MAELCERYAGNGGSPHFVGVGLWRIRFRSQVHQVPNGRKRHAQMRIIAENGVSGRRPMGCDNPIVAAVTRGMETGAGESGIGKMPKAASRFLRGTRNRRPVFRVGWKEGAQLFRLVV